MEAFHPLLVASKLIGQNLQGNIAPESRVVGEIDLSHAARPDDRQNFEMRELSPYADHGGGGLYLRLETAKELVDGTFQQQSHIDIASGMPIDVRAENCNLLPASMGITPYNVHGGFSTAD